MSTKYETLLERNIRSQEISNNVSKSLLEVAKELKDNTEKLNDGFILHNLHSESLQKEVTDIKLELMKWIKYLAVALFIAVGGTAIVKFFINEGLIKLFT